MPAKSEAQRRLMAAAAHGAMFPKAKKLRASMSPDKLSEFASPVPRPSGESYAYHWRSRANLKRGS